MLSFILKPFLGQGGKNIELPELDSDTELSLSLIQSGCVYVLLRGKTILIIKKSENDIASLVESDHISLDFELIERPEFPSLGAYINIYDAEDNPTRFEYFFSMESHDEMELLEKLTEQDYLDIVFYTSDVEHVKRTTLNETQKEELTSLLAKAKG